MYLTQKGKKFEFSRVIRLGGYPPLALVLPDIFNRSNFEYSAFSGLKVDSRRRIIKKKKVRKK